MNKKALFGILSIVFFLALASVVSAAPTVGETSNYWTLENLVDSVSGTSLTANSVTSGVTGIIDNAYDLSGSSSYLGSGSNILNVTDADDFTINLWVYDNTPSTRSSFFDMGAGTNIFGFVGESGTLANGDLRILAQEGGHTFYTLSAATGTITTNTWQMITYVQSGSNGWAALYVDCVLEDNQTITTTTTTSSTSDLNFGRNHASYSWDGRLDEIAVFPTDLTKDDSCFLYASGSPTSAEQYPFPTASGSNLTITLTDDWDNSALVNVSATLLGETFTNTTGNILYTNISLNDSIVTQINYTAQDYFSQTVEQNLSANVAQTLYQSEISFNATEILTGNALTGVTFNISSNTNNPKYLKSGSYNVIASKSGYFDRVYNFSVSALDNTTMTVTDMSDTVINLTASKALVGTPITNFSGWLYHYDTGTNITFSTTTGFYEISSAQNELFLLHVVSNGYVTTEVNITPNATIFDYDIEMYGFNSVVINIYNGTTTDLLDQLVTIDVIDFNDGSYQNTTSAGTITLELLDPSSYELRFSSSVGNASYNTISTFISVLNDSTQAINVYMTLNSTAQRVRVVDTTNTLLEGAIVRVQKETIGVEDNFITIQEAETNAEGIAFVFIEKNPSIYYRFSLVYQDETRPISPSGNLFTSKTSFLSTIDEVLQIAVDLTTPAEDQLNNINGVSGSIVIIDNYTFSFTYSDALNSITSASLTIRAKYLNETDKSYQTIDINSSSETSGTLTYTVPIINNTVWEATAKVSYTNNDLSLDQKIIFIEGNQTPFSASSGAFWAVLLFAFIVVLTLSTGVVVSSIISFGLLMILILLNILTLPIGLITGFLAIALIVFVKPKNNDGGKN